MSNISGVSVVIPNYNGEILIKKHLPSILKASKNKKNRIEEIIIVDDASTDTSVDMIKNKFSQVKIIEQKINQRFAATVNNGFKNTKNEIICLLNSDVSVSQDFLEKVLPHFEDDKVFGVSLHEKGYFYTKGAFVNGFVVYEEEERNKIHETFWVSGGSGVFRKSIWQKLGGMDNELFTPFYWEDIDISYRAVKRGYRVLWEPDSLVYHEHESTNKLFQNKFKRQIQERNQLLFIWKNITSKRLIKRHLIGLVRRVLLGPGYLVVVVKALLKIHIVLKRRKVERKQSKISDESILAKIT